MSARLRPLRTLKWIGRQLWWGVRATADLSSCYRYSVDVVLYHLLSRVRLASTDARRRIRLRDGTVLHYRLNRGDIQSIREIWVNECYRPPEGCIPRTIIDLGANIGMTSVFFAMRYPDAAIIAVEPNPSNCLLLRDNFISNSISATIVRAAVGPASGVGHFATAADSNLGHLAAEGEIVEVVTMASLLAQTAAGVADLVKMDIEGGEGELLNAEDVTWLGSVGVLLAEFHPPLVDYGAMIERVTDAGFRYIPGGSLRAEAVDCFIRT